MFELYTCYFLLQSVVDEDAEFPSERQYRRRDKPGSALVENESSEEDEEVEQSGSKEGDGTFQKPTPPVQRTGADSAPGPSTRDDEEEEKEEAEGEEDENKNDEELDEK